MLQKSNNQGFLSDVYSFRTTSKVHFNFSCVFFRVNPGLVTQRSSQFPTGTSHRRNYRFLLSHDRLLIFLNFDLSIKLIISTVCLQLLEQLRSNRASLKPPQLQMLGQLEAQLAMMQQHQHQVKRKKLQQSFTVINPADLNHQHP